MGIGVLRFWVAYGFGLSWVRTSVLGFRVFIATAMLDTIPQFHTGSSLN